MSRIAPMMIHGLTLTLTCQRGGPSILEAAADAVELNTRARSASIPLTASIAPISLNADPTMRNTMAYAATPAVAPIRLIDGALAEYWTSTGPRSAIRSQVSGSTVSLLSTLLPSAAVNA